MGARTGASCLALLLAAVACKGEDQPAPSVASAARRPGLTFGDVPLDQFCERRSEAECHRLQVCGPRQLTSTYGDLFRCNAERTEDCERGFVELSASVVVELGLVRIDPTALGLALTEFSRRHCASAVTPPSPLAGAVGLLAEGDGCSGHAVCASGWCESPGGGCGRCAERPQGASTTCTSCPAGQTCRCSAADGGPRRCACVEALRMGADCSAGRTLCDEGLACVDYLDGEDRPRTACLPIPFEGERCGPKTGFTACVGDAYCSISGEEGLCAAPRLVLPGESCDTSTLLCPVGHDCRGVCVPRASRGDACISSQVVNIPDGGPPTCREGPCAGVCQEPFSRGGFCVRSSDCSAELGCSRAVLFGGGICESAESIAEEIRGAFRCP